jgi:tetratricopeptide (TPR) repeat protein
MRRSVLFVENTPAWALRLRTTGLAIGAACALSILGGADDLAAQTNPAPTAKRSTATGSRPGTYPQTQQKRTTPSSMPNSTPGMHRPGQSPAAKPTGVPAAQGQAQSQSAAVDPATIKIEAAGLKGVTPGVSTVEQMKAAWGAPKQTQTTQGTTRYGYEITGFKQVDVYSRGNVVSYILVTFQNTFPPDVVATQLKFTGLEPVLVYDDAGKPMGQVFPERGVVFSFDPKSPSIAVSQLLLEGINAEEFVVRAESRWVNRPQASLSDVNEALRRDPNHDRGHFVRAQILATHHQPSEALTAIERAINLENGKPEYHLLKAKVLMELGRHNDAVAVVNQVLTGNKVSPQLVARAQCLQGDLWSDGPSRDLKQALQAHMQAIETASTAISSKNSTVRREAKRVLVDAHLAAANDIALGSWNKKETIIPKWLTKAGEATDDLVKNEGADTNLRFEVARRTVAIAAAASGKVDATPATTSLQTLGNRLISSSNDPLYKSRIAWHMAEGLYDAMQDCHARGQAGAATQLGQTALRELALVSPKPDAHDYLVGQIYYRLGAEQAVFHNDHAAAVGWYNKAAPLLEKPLAIASANEIARQGESFISMGVSYWQIGDKQKAVDYTSEGVHLVEQAVGDGLADKAQLEVPYANLANMHRELGDSNSSKKFADMATRIKTETRQR